MKLALSKSISHISLPDKNRPLDPRKDFTIASSLQFKKANVNGKEGPQARGRTADAAQQRSRAGGVSCCSSSSVKEQRPPPLASRYRPESFPGVAVEQHEPFTGVQRSATAAGAVDHDDDDHENDDDSEDDIDGHHATKAPASFVFTDYSPMAYRHIRGFFNVEPQAYRQVLVQSTWHSVPTPGKSSAQLFFCGQNWVIKTMITEESDFLRNVLHKYYYHARDNPSTLLPHFVGHHMIELNGKKITFVIMQNVFATANKIHEKYDLKGSTIGRFATKVEKMKQTCTQKDLDINRPILIGEARRELLTDQMKKDCDFLRRSSIMDYSLLIGIHVVPRGSGRSSAQTAGGDHHNDDSGNGEGNTAAAAAAPNAPVATSSASSELDGKCFTADQGGMLSHDEVNGRREIYYIGIIDILQEYNLWKRSETLVMGIRRRSLHQISSVPPNEYASRFLSFMSSLLV
ncbi:phosphatidylinositol-4-phosphate 5-kinase, putative [Bodo saltans]|uniref:Phosphatidylinositol-4-phosphate 5-kinase, putative n=1 Tax=Bodo saltans TaxID=75058 RepID=A0A0S4IZA7_BODSA|nr:phosphatidylinositol-4-phosphate 5-kinase, putative [Bodo saltans]|eukprot:CUG64347.1 phosphatidylinositol-4-phosphate 5-kinase, putative [Bodo saltans]